MSETRISPYNLADLKNTTDDAVGNYLRGLNFKQNNSKIDVRLALGYLSVIVAGATFVADYKLGWEATKGWTAVAVAAYALFNGGLTWWMFAVEKGGVFAGSKAGKKVSITSISKKHDPTYYLTVKISLPNTTPSVWHIRAPFTAWFTADGYFVAQPFQQWLASSIELIGDEDLANAGRDERDNLAAPGVPVAATASAATNAGVTSGSDAKSSGKKRRG